MGPIVLIYLLVAIAWFVLAASVDVRTDRMEGALKGRVAALWGDSQEQVSPQLNFTWPETVQRTEEVEEAGVKRNVTTTSVVWKERPVLLDRSDLATDFALGPPAEGPALVRDLRASASAPTTGTSTGRRSRASSSSPTASPRATRPTTTSASRWPATPIPRSCPLDTEQCKMVQHRIPVGAGPRFPSPSPTRSRGLDWWRYSFGQRRQSGQELLA